MLRAISYVLTFSGGAVFGIAFLLFITGRERVSEEGGVISGRTENESQGQESPEDDQGWSGGRKPDR